MDVQKTRLQMKPKTLREALQSAVNQRNTAMRNGRSYRKDIDALRASIGRAEVFLGGYPVAADERVCEYVRANLDDLGRILLGNAKGPLMKVYKEALKQRQNHQFIRA
jgi:hypothetical protein